MGSTINPRYLITTADERTWKFDRPVVFLGEWCRRYDRRHVWSEMDAIVAEPYGLGQVQRDKDHASARATEQELAEIVSNELNAVHGMNHGHRYWQIVLGHWLRRYVDLIFNRYHTLQQCLDSHPASGMTVLEALSEDKHFPLARPDSLAFIWACNDEIWNNVLCGRILSFVPGEDLTVETTSIEDLPVTVESADNQPIPVGAQLKKTIQRSVEVVASLFCRDSDAFIVNSYLPLAQEVKLQLSLGQMPQRWHSPDPETYDPDPQLRKELARRVSNGSGSGFTACAQALLFELLPTCYLEGFKALDDQARRLPWPKQPRLIFTSNNFDTDEVFKCWTAGKVERGAIYFTGQHGNNYGTHRYSNPSIEESTADQFLTWGWTTNGHNQQTPAFLFKTAGRKPGNWRPNGQLLLVEVCTPHRIGPEDSYFDFGIYQEDQFRFVAALPEPLQQELTVRFHGGYRDFHWCEEQRWQDRSPDTTIETGATGIQELIEQSRLVVHSYDSTGILETLALNIPTLCFWQGGLDHLLDSAKPYYELLRAAKILVDSPEQAAEMIALHWDDIGAWWSSRKVQDARQAFCEQYAKTEECPVRTMKRLLVAHESS